MSIRESANLFSFLVLQKVVTTTTVEVTAIAKTSITTLKQKHQLLQ
jgi:hypothetical protein